MTALKPTHLDPSPLGTKEYWNSLYTTEIHNHALDPSDVGTIWFDDSLAEEKVLAFLRSPALQLDRRTTSFLDLGTGNGHFLIRLREGNDEDEEKEEEEEEEEGEGEEEGGKGPRRGRDAFLGPMVGTDYSEPSIQFARQLALDRGFGAAEDTKEEKETNSPSSSHPIAFAVWDILTSSLSELAPYLHSSPSTSSPTFDVLLDKGTFDAISLSASTTPAGQRIVETYPARILPLMKADGGLFVVTSCNWTSEELRGWFEGDELEVVGEVAYKGFRFGGREGQTVCSVCFRRRGGGRNQKTGEK